MSFGVDVANIYELLDDENAEVVQKKVAPKGESTKKDTKPAQKSSGSSAPSKPQPDSRKNERSNAAGKENRDRSLDKSDRRPRDTQRTENQEGTFEKRNQARRNKEKGERVANNDRERTSHDRERANNNRERPPANEENASQRPKRTFDRRSGTGRGREIKRGGSGKANWGSISEDAEVPQEEGPKVESEAQVEGQTPQEGQEKKEEVKEEDPEDKFKSLDEYQKTLEEKRARINIPLPEQRRAGDGVDQAEWANLVEYRKETEAEATKKEKKAKDVQKETGKKKTVVPVNEILRIDAPKRQRPPRDRESPNQRRRNNSGKNFAGKKTGSGNKGEPNFTTDESSFPALSAKA